MIWLLALQADRALSLTVHKVVITLILVIVHTIWLVITSIITRVLSNSVSMCLIAVYIKSEVKSGSNFWSAFVSTISSSCRNGTMSNSSLSKIIYWCPLICLNKIQCSPWFLSKNGISKPCPQIVFPYIQSIKFCDINKYIQPILEVHKSFDFFTFDTQIINTHFVICRDK